MLLSLFCWIDWMYVSGIQSIISHCVGGDPIIRLIWLCGVVFCFRSLKICTFPFRQFIVQLPVFLFFVKMIKYSRFFPIQINPLEIIRLQAVFLFYWIANFCVTVGFTSTITFVMHNNKYVYKDTVKMCLPYRNLHTRNKMITMMIVVIVSRLNLWSR